MKNKTIRFFFDFISPYSYLAWTQLDSLVERTNASLEPIPILFAALLNTHGQKGPAEIPPKRLYMFKELLRRAHGLGVPLVPPPHHPFNSLLALRVVSLPRPDKVRHDLIDSFFRATWGKGSGIESMESIIAIANGLGLDGDTLIREAGSPETKNRLREQTDDAIKEGVFGVPTMIVGNELFWGADSLQHLEAYIQGEDPLQQRDHELFQRWKNIVPSATRR